MHKNKRRLTKKFTPISADISRCLTIRQPLKNNKTAIKHKNHSQNIEADA